jgi:ribosomal small subunit protein bTHX
MGKGDIKSKKGKLSNGSFGKSRKRNETMPKKDFTAVAVVEAAEKPKKAAASKPKAKKA